MNIWGFSTFGNRKRICLPLVVLWQTSSEDFCFECAGLMGFKSVEAYERPRISEAWKSEEWVITQMYSSSPDHSSELQGAYLISITHYSFEKGFEPYSLPHPNVKH
ncbi:hypothetical protein AVEN_274225-1 [Araneus ventricosus]|uniref:Uncharacterized protein n=1 Tax=Araneus ventricosus TaxID=182803 RepID=A0A4Y2G7C1_ARAVE|nr:hypothetical protein AVEN_274225-1 [Araneus ventricosus]